MNWISETIWPLNLLFNLKKQNFFDLKWWILTVYLLSLVIFCLHFASAWGNFGLHLLQKVNSTLKFSLVEYFFRYFSCVLKDWNCTQIFCCPHCPLLRFSENTKWNWGAINKKAKGKEIPLEFSLSGRFDRRLTNRKRSGD